MDIPRYALIAASVLLGLMLLGEWTRFSTAQQEARSPQCPWWRQKRRHPTPLTRWRWWAPHLRRHGSSYRRRYQPYRRPNADRASPATTATGRIVTVHTDVLEIKIDLEGGDVVGAALKDYPKTLDDPADPFVLLERNAMRTYVAQSGLVGPDGIDQNQRARYRASQDVYTMSGGEPLEVVIDYAGTDSALRVSKHFDFEPGSHTIGVHYTITNLSSRSGSVNAVCATQTR